VILYIAQEAATFQGETAETEFGKYIYSILRYPEDAVQNGVDGLASFPGRGSPAGGHPALHLPGSLCSALKGHVNQGSISIFRTLILP